MHSRNRNIEKTSGQTAQFNIWTILYIVITSPQSQVNLILLRSIYLKFCSLWTRKWPFTHLEKSWSSVRYITDTFWKKQCCRIKGGLEDELTVECYEADLDRWTPGPGLPGGNRSQHAAVRVQDRLYVSGGLDHDTVLSSLLGIDFSLFGDFVIEKTTF